MVTGIHQGAEGSLLCFKTTYVDQYLQTAGSLAVLDHLKRDVKAAPASKESLGTTSDWIK